MCGCFLIQFWLHRYEFDYSSPSLLNEYLWYDKLWGPSQRVVTLFIVLIKSSVMLRFKPWLASLILFYFWSVLSAMSIDYCDRKYWTYIFLLIYLWRDHQIQLGHFLELFKAMNIDYCDRRLERERCLSICEKVANSSGPLSSWPALTQTFNLIAYFALVQKKSKQNSEM